MSEVRWIRCSEKLPCKFTPKNYAEAHASERRYIVCKKSGNVTMATWKFFCTGANKSSLIGGWGWKGDEGDSRFMCSECKCKEYVPTCMGVPDIWEYCPNCGARMDEE